MRDCQAEGCPHLAMSNSVYCSAHQEPVISHNYGLTRHRQPRLDSSKHIELAMKRLCFPEEIRSVRLKLALTIDPKRKNSLSN